VAEDRHGGQRRQPARLQDARGGVPQIVAAKMAEASRAQDRFDGVGEVARLGLYWSRRRRMAKRSAPLSVLRTLSTV